MHSLSSVLPIKNLKIVVAIYGNTCHYPIMRRRAHDIKITVNGLKIVQVVIDPHYELKHSDSVDEQTILGLVALLDGLRFEPEDSDSPFQYFVADGLVLDGKRYKLVWLLEDNKLYIGVVNAYRRK